MVLGMHQHQADLHFPFALVAFDKLGLHAMRLAQRLARLLHHRFRCRKVALLRLLQRAIGQATGLSGVDNQPHHYLFEVIFRGLYRVDVVQIKHNISLIYQAVRDAARTARYQNFSALAMSSSLSSCSITVCALFDSTTNGR